MLLATKQAVENAYVVVTTNGAVGTDQDANTFWDKIKENFVHIITKVRNSKNHRNMWLKGGVQVIGVCIRTGRMRKNERLYFLEPALQLDKIVQM